MTDFDLRTLPHTDPVLAAMDAYAFGDSPTRPEASADRERDVARGRDTTTWVSCVDGEPVAKAGVHPMSMNVRGRVLPMGGVGGVATMPLGRRGGHVRALMHRALEGMRDAGQPVSGLYAFRESFYQRLGYVAMQRPRWASIDPARLSPLLRVATEGSLRHRSIRDGAHDWAAVQQTVQSRTHAMMLPGPAREAAWADHDDQWLVSVHEGDTITGAMPFRIAENTLVAAAMLWTTRSAQLQLLGFVARHVDQVAKARLPLMPGSDADFWATDTDIAVTTADPASWGPALARIVSVAELGGIGAGDGRVVVAVTDDHAPWNTGTWTLHGADGTLQVRAGGEPECSLPVEALGAALFAGIDPAIFGWRGWGNVPDDVADRLRTMFPPVAAHAHALF